MTLMPQIIRILGSSRWAKYRLVILLICISAIVETASVAAIIPLTKLFPGDTGFAWFGLGKLSSFQLALGFVLLYLAGISLRIISTYYVTTTTMQEGFWVGSKLFKNYLNQSYEWHIYKSSPEAFSLILKESQDFTTFIMLPIGRLLSQLVLTLLLVSVLLIVQPLLTIVTGGILVLAYLSTYALIRKRLSSDGQIELDSYRSRQRTCAEALGSIRETKLSKLEEKFSSEFYQISETLGLVSTRLSIRKDIPKLVLEACIIIFLIGYGLILTMSDGANQEGLTPNIAVFAVASLKLFPMGHQIFHNFSILRSHQPLVDKIEAALIDFKPTDTSIPISEFQHEIRLQDVTFSYPSSEKFSVNNINLTIKSGQKIAITGPSGSGKSTLIDLISGLIHPTSGTVFVDNIPLTKDNSLAWQDQLQFCPQNPFLFDVSIAENIALSDEYDMQVVRTAAKLASADEFITAMVPDKYDTSVGERGSWLSGGQLQRICIARAVFRNVPVYIFDEPTSNLDPVMANRLMEEIFETKKDAVILVVTHDPTLAALCNLTFELG